MNWKWKGPLGCAAALLLGITLWLGLIFYLARKSDPFLAEATLADGQSRLRLLSVTEGPFDYEWQPSRASSILPFGRHLPPISIHLSGVDPWTQAPGPTWMFRMVDDQGRYSNPNNSSLNFEFVDSQGFAYRRFGFADYPHWGAYAFTRSNYPRRDRELTIRIRDRGGLNLQFTDMRIPNPFYRESFPNWTPQPLPLELTRGSIKARVRAIDYYESENTEGIVRFEIDNLSDSPEWKNCLFDNTLEDATGNRGRELSPFETAWKVIVQARRNPEGEFPHELLSEKFPLTVPAAGQLQTLDRVVEFAGKKCRLRCIAGPGKVEFSGGQFKNEVVADAPSSTGYSSGSQNGRVFMSATSSKPQLFFSWETQAAGVTNRGTGIHFLGGLADHVMRQVNPDGTLVGLNAGTMFDGQTELHSCELQVAPGSSTVTIQLAANPPEKLEFLVAPPQKAIDYWKKQAAELSPAKSK